MLPNQGTQRVEQIVGALFAANPRADDRGVPG
ncbi:hypothetical protein BH24ACT12_BH24ACT12_20910 [soil metagenome]|jgi:hypothetical protein